MQTVIDFLLMILPLLVWMAFWFFAADWKSIWPVLTTGADVALALLVILSAMVWSQIYPQPVNLPVLRGMGNFWSHLTAVMGLTGAAFFSGWLQGISGYEPVEVPLETEESSHADAQH